jgi:hypothetical protein
MTRAKFRQVDVTRALRAFKAAGFDVARCEIDAEGKIVLVSPVGHVVRQSDNNSVAPSGLTALERWELEQNGPPQK